MLNCVRCDQYFPSVYGVPLLTLRPFGTLAALKSRGQAAWLHLRDLEAYVASRQGSSAEATTRRFICSLEAQKRNQRLFDHLMQQASSIPAGQFTVLDELYALNQGWSLGQMLPYFSRDWGQYRPRFAAIQANLKKYGGFSSNRDFATVLAAGACGSAVELSRHFTEVNALDLSLPSLLMANKLINGADIQCDLETTGWEVVLLKGTPAPISNVHLIAADCYCTPLPTASQSLVVTEHVMDLLGSPLAVMSEINRILKPGGIWINATLPFTLAGDPRDLGLLSMDELLEIVRGKGFECVQASVEHLHEIEGINPADHPRRDNYKVYNCFFQKTSNGRCPASVEECSLRVVPRSLKIAQWSEFPQNASRQSAHLSFRKFSVPASEAVVSLFGNVINQAAHHAPLSVAVKELKVLHPDLGSNELEGVIYHLAHGLGVISLHSSASQ